MPSPMEEVMAALERLERCANGPIGSDGMYASFVRQADLALVLPILRKDIGSGGVDEPSSDASDSASPAADVVGLLRKSEWYVAAYHQDTRDARAAETLASIRAALHQEEV